MSSAITILNSQFLCNLITEVIIPFSLIFYRSKDDLYEINFNISLLCDDWFGPSLILYVIL